MTMEDGDLMTQDLGILRPALVLQRSRSIS